MTWVLYEVGKYTDLGCTWVDDDCDCDSEDGLPIWQPAAGYYAGDALCPEHLELIDHYNCDYCEDIE